MRRASLRVATLEEVAHYGRTLPRGLRAPIMGAAPPALVGSVGTAAQAGTAGANVTPTFGTGESRTAGNLLVCWATDGQTGAKVPTTTTSGWSTPTSSLLGNAACCIMLKVATGGDAGPAVTGNGRAWAQVAEFSATTATTDATGAGSGTATPTSGTAGSPDAASGELVLVCWSLRVGPAATVTGGALTFNNATLTTGGTLINDSSSVQNHFRNGYAVTTTNATAGSATSSWTGGTTQDSTVCFITLLLPATPGGAAGVMGIRRPVDMRTTPSTGAVFTG